MSKKSGSTSTRARARRAPIVSRFSSRSGGRATRSGPIRNGATSARRVSGVRNTAPTRRSVASGRGARLGSGTARGGVRSINGRRPRHANSGYRGARRPYSYFCESPYWRYNRYCFTAPWGFRSWSWCYRPWAFSSFYWLPVSNAFCWDNPWRYTYSWVDPWCPTGFVNPYYFAPTAYLAFASSLDDSDDVGPVRRDAPAAPAAPAVVRADKPTDETLATYYVELADLYFETERYSRAVLAYERAIRLVPDDASLRLALADAHMALGDYDKAAFSLRKGLEFAPELAGSSFDKRESYGKARELDKHIAAMREHVAAREFDTNARLCLCWTLRFSGRIDEATTELARLEELLPGDSTVAALRAAWPSAEAAARKRV